MRRLALAAVVAAIAAVLLGSMAPRATRSHRVTIKHESHLPAWFVRRRMALQSPIW
ncbi:MAG TPA: hypothetical protein VIG32_04765 [Candidatus Baltobacteraceae bacterium]